MALDQWKAKRGDPVWILAYGIWRQGVVRAVHDRRVTVAYRNYQNSRPSEPPILTRRLWDDPKVIPGSQEPPGRWTQVGSMWSKTQ